MQQTTVATVVQAVMRTGTGSELLATLDAYYREIAIRDGAVTFGVKKVPGRSIERERKEANAAALAVLARVGNDPSLLTEEDRAPCASTPGKAGSAAPRMNTTPRNMWPRAFGTPWPPS